MPAGSLAIDFRDQIMHRDFFLVGDALQGVPNYRFKADVGAMAGNVDIVHH